MIPSTRSAHGGDSVKRLPLIIAAGSLVGGFVTMGVVSLVWTPPAGLPAMWNYWSGTVGDLLLPVVVYGLPRGCILLADPGERPSWWSLLVGGFGALLGAASQAAWLIDAHPRLTKANISKWTVQAVM